jgi:hypothetical protein
LPCRSSPLVLSKLKQCLRAYREDLRIGLAPLKPHNGFAMRNFCCLGLLLCCAGLSHATIVYTTQTGDLSANVDRQILDSPNNASSYAVEVGLINLRYIGGEFIPNTGPLFSGYLTNYLDQSTTNSGGMARLEEGIEVSTGNAASTNRGVPGMLPGNGTLGFAGCALIGVGWIRRPGSASLWRRTL